MRQVGATDWKRGWHVEKQRRRKTRQQGLQGSDGASPVVKVAGEGVVGPLRDEGGVIGWWYCHYCYLRYYQMMLAELQVWRCLYDVAG